MTVFPESCLFCLLNLTSLSSSTYFMNQFIIDDVYGDKRPGSNASPFFAPFTDYWNEANGEQVVGPGLSFYSLPDSSQIVDGSWHAVTASPGNPAINMTITFIGEWDEPLSGNGLTLLLQEPVFLSIASYRPFSVPALLLL